MRTQYGSYQQDAEGSRRAGGRDAVGGTTRRNVTDEAEQLRPALTSLTSEQSKQAQQASSASKHSNRIGTIATASTSNKFSKQSTYHKDLRWPDQAMTSSSYEQQTQQSNTANKHSKQSSFDRGSLCIL